MGAQVGPRCRPQHNPSRSQIPTSSQNRRMSNNLHVLLNRAEGGCARAWPNRVQADRGHGPAECNSPAGQVAGQAVELIVHPPSVHWSKSHLDSHPELGGPLIEPKSKASPTGNPSGLTAYKMPGIPSIRSRLGSRRARTLVYHPGARLRLAGSQKASFQQRMTPESERFCLAATCSISTRMTQTKGTPKHPQSKLPR